MGCFGFKCARKNGFGFIVYSFGRCVVNVDTLNGLLLVGCGLFQFNLELLYIMRIFISLLTL